MNQNTKAIAKSALIVSLFTISIGALATWTNPPAGLPPSSNVLPPINASANAQMKPGPFRVAGFMNEGITIMNGTVEIDGKLDLKSTSEGLILPRMTKAERDGMKNPVVGTIFYQMDDNPGVYMYGANGWISLEPATGKGSEPPKG